MRLNPAEDEVEAGGSGIEPAAELEIPEADAGGRALARSDLGGTLIDNSASR
jgi:hypothetical protein